MDEQLGLSEAILDGLRERIAKGATPDDMIQYLHDSGVTKPGSTIALRRTKAMPIAETKLAVHAHPAFAYRRDTDEAFRRDVMSALDTCKRRTVPVRPQHSSCWFLAHFHVTSR